MTEGACAPPVGASSGKAPAVDALAVDALVSGRGLPALLAALDLAEVGLRVAVAPGGFEAPRGPERDAEGEIAGFLERVAAPVDAASGAMAPDLADADTDAGVSAGPDHPAHPTDARLLPVAAPPRAPWLRDVRGSWAPQSEPSVLGVPAVPLSAETLRILGPGAATRAYLDRLMPLLTIGKTRSFGELARRRLGRGACARLVEPLLRERYGVGAERVEVAIAAPGLNEALSRAGSLSSAALAYGDRNAQRERRVEPAAGWTEVGPALLRRLALYGVELLGTPIAGVEAVDSAWSVALDGAPRPLRARAIVLDRGRELRPEAPGLVGPELGPARVRLHAEIGIREPEGLPADASAVESLGAHSLRIEQAAPGRWLATVCGPVEDPGHSSLAEGPAGVDESSGADPEIVGLDAILSEAGLEIDAARAAADAAAGWRTELRAAPFAAVDERERATAALEAVARLDPPLLPVGASLHGDDLGAALGAAHRGAVELRRRLLGLSE